MCRIAVTDGKPYLRYCERSQLPPGSKLPISTQAPTLNTDLCCGPAQTRLKRQWERMQR